MCQPRSGIHRVDEQLDCILPADSAGSRSDDQNDQSREIPSPAHQVIKDKRAGGPQISRRVFGVLVAHEKGRDVIHRAIRSKEFLDMSFGANSWLCRSNSASSSASLMRLPLSSGADRRPT